MKYLIDSMRGMVEHLLPGRVERDSGTALSETRQPLLRQVHHFPSRCMGAIGFVIGQGCSLEILGSLLNETFKGKD